MKIWKIEKEVESEEFFGELGKWAGKVHIESNAILEIKEKTAESERELKELLDELDGKTPSKKGSQRMETLTQFLDQARTQTLRHMDDLSHAAQSVVKLVIVFQELERELEKVASRELRRLRGELD